MRPLRIAKFTGIAVAAGMTKCIGWIKAGANTKLDIERAFATCRAAVSTHDMVKVYMQRQTDGGTDAASASVTITTPNTHYASETVQATAKRAETANTNWTTPPNVDGDKLNERNVHPTFGWYFKPTDDEGDVPKDGYMGIWVENQSGGDEQTFDAEIAFREG